MHPNHSPLAARLRPQTFTDVIGQSHLLAPHKPLWQILTTGEPHSLLLWGPPGTGKTTLAKLMAEASKAHFMALSAVMSGIKDIREAIDTALHLRQQSNQKTVLFVDEVHRFNKSQQDVFLPFVEDGTFIFMGATTENPSFEINNALLSRCRVYGLKALEETELLKVIERALTLIEQEQQKSISCDRILRTRLVQSVNGDARQALNLLELYLSTARQQGDTLYLDAEGLESVLMGTVSPFDKGGDIFYEQISALHKAVRGSSPDGALYWLARMLEGGCDPLYIARRLIRMASEDIGNADPKALDIALSAWDVQSRLGSPEGELAMAQALVYLAVAPKSNAVYKAFKAAQHDAAKSALPVPLHLRNAPTAFMRREGYGLQYRYDHDEPHAFSAGQTYFPEKMGEKIYYQPAPRGLEIKIQAKLEFLRALSAKTPSEDLE